MLTEGIVMILIACLIVGLFSKIAERRKRI
jgi:hypothetical protein